MSTITHPQLVSVCVKSGIQLVNEMTPLKAHLNHMLIGIAGEIGELITAVVNSDKPNQIEEFGDLEFYLEGARVSLGISREETIIGEPVNCNYLRDNILLRIVSSSGDVIDAIKQHTVYNKSYDRDLVVKNLAKLEFWLDILRGALTINRRGTLDHNIEKLSERYAKLTGDIGYSDAAAIARADKDPERN